MQVFLGNGFDMVHNRNKNWSGCPIRFSMGQFGDKWSFLIIRDLMFKNLKYYHQFLESGEGISTNILAKRLADLEKNEIIAKKRDQIKKSRFVYSLTEKGTALLPLFLTMIDWAEKYDQATEVPKDFISDFRHKPDEVTRDLQESLKKYA